MVSSYLAAHASFSPCGTYRYQLWREWRLGGEKALWDMWTDDDGAPVLDGAGSQLGEPLSCVFIMLNPSTADAAQDDPTIRRCVSFAKALRFDRLDVVNLFAFRATKPADLLALQHVDEPWGPHNEKHVGEALEMAGIIICAWGADGGHLDQDQTMLGWIERHNNRRAPVVALGLTKDGFPRHPLYLRGDAQPIPYTGRPSHAF